MDTHGEINEIKHTLAGQGHQERIYYKNIRKIIQTSRALLQGTPRLLFGGFQATHLHAGE